MRRTMNNNNDISIQKRTITLGKSCLIGSKQQLHISNFAKRSFFCFLMTFMSLLFCYPVYAVDVDTDGDGILNSIDLDDDNRFVNQ